MMRMTTSSTTKILTTPDIDTSELDKLLAIKDQSHQIAKFIEFLRNQGYSVQYDVEEQLAKFFGIDRAKAEAQRLALWESMKTKIN
jgi:hypothetical protein